MSTLRFLTAGESHGPGLTIVVEGIPAGLPIDEEYIRGDLARRQPELQLVQHGRVRPAYPPDHLRREG